MTDLKRPKLNFGVDTKDTRAFALLPPGAVKAGKWLKKQLEMMRDGITGEMENYPDYYNSEWLGVRGGEDWERGPYYLRGLVALAYVLDDEGLREKADRWINAIIASQRDGGMFGPYSNEDWWSRMPVLMALRDYLEALEYRGAGDERIIPFIEDYMRYQASHLPERPLNSWARARGGDNIDSVYWLYSRLYDEKDPDKTKWLLDLASLLYSQTQDWRSIMNDTTVREHVVNTSQALKAPVLFWQQSGDERDRSAFENCIRNFGIDHGRIDELPNSDEAARDNKSTRGSELCGIVEGMLSSEIALRVLREAWIGDRLERLAYNALPSGYSYDYKSHVYFILQNQVMATNGYHEFDCDHGDSSAFGAPSGFDCCFANNHMGWPKFVQSMWMATKKGIAATAFGPCRVDHDGIAFTENTNYPFDNRIEFIYEGEEKEFELLVRIPEWAVEGSGLAVNGESVNIERGSFASVARRWKKGDVCALTVESAIRRESGYNDSVGFTKGPLIYSLPVKESWKDLTSNNARELKVPALGKLKNSEVSPASAWNYAVFEDTAEYLPAESVADHPFTQATAPTAIRIKGQRVPGWSLDGNIAAVQPYGGAKADPDRAETLTLVPYGCTRLKITHFPRVGKNGNTAYPEYSEDGKSAYFRGINLPEAEDYDIVIYGSGEGSARINNVYETGISFIDGKCVIKNAKTLISDRAFAFTRDHYNNIALTGCRADRIEIVAVNEFRSPKVREITLRDRSVTITLDADRSFCPFEVLYGQARGVYTHRVSGFKGRRADINGLGPSRTYYFKVRYMISGDGYTTDEMALTTLPDVIRPAADVKEFTISAVTAFECAQITYSRVPEADRYEVLVSKDGSDFNDRIADVIFNPYKGSGIFTEDKTSLSLESGHTYTLKMNAYKDNRLVATSNDITATV